jgi:hypothetical protein
VLGGYSILRLPTLEVSVNCYIVEINGEPFTIHAFTADEAERMALREFSGMVMSLLIRIAEDEVCTKREASSSATRG